MPKFIFLELIHKEDKSELHTLYTWPPFVTHPSNNPRQGPCWFDPPSSLLIFWTIEVRTRRARHFSNAITRISLWALLLNMCKKDKSRRAQSCALDMQNSQCVKENFSLTPHRFCQENVNSEIWRRRDWWAKAPASCSNVRRSACASGRMKNFDYHT